jgi:hypothetical protein
MVWREFKDWPRVQKGLPAMPRSPTPEAATNGPIPEAPVDRPELGPQQGRAAAPSENGTAARNSRDLEAPNPNLSVDDLAVAAWNRLGKEIGQPPSIARVAREIGHTRQHLYRCRHFMALVATEKAQRDERKQRLVRGWKDASGGVEAYQDED